MHPDPLDLHEAGVAHATEYLEFVFAAATDRFPPNDPRSARDSLACAIGLLSSTNVNPDLALLRSEVRDFLHLILHGIAS